MTKVLRICLFAGCMLNSAFAVQPAVVKVHEGEHWVWFAQRKQFEEHAKDIERFYDYADRAFRYLKEAWALEPPRQKYALLVWHKVGGGFATGNIAEVRPLTGKRTPGIGVSYDAFFNTAHGIKGYWGYALITHEMVNLFTAQTVSGGWPTDWWANHRSPFPLMTAVQIEHALVPQVAVYHGRELSTPLGQMFLHLKDQYGWALFRRAFAAARKDGINWERIGQNPSALRTNYVCAYLQAHAPEDLASYLTGVVPNFDAKMVTDILKARQRWQSLPEGDSRRRALHAAFLRGNYRQE